MCSDSRSTAQSPGQELSGGLKLFILRFLAVFWQPLEFTDEFMEYLGLRRMLSDFGFSWAMQSVWKPSAEGALSTSV